MTVYPIYVIIEKLQLFSTVHAKVQKNYNFLGI